MRTRPWWFYNQSAVITYRRLDGGDLQVLLITSRGRGRWIIPKGVVDLGKDARESAANEAYEEAGVKGRTSSEPIGEYSYTKWGGTCTVKVYLLEVQTLLDEWPEKDFRQRVWMTLEKAAESVKEEDLRHMILSMRDGAGKSKLL